MSEETIHIFTGLIEPKVEVAQAEKAIDELENRLSSFASHVGSFETEVKDFGTGLALAFEAPKKPLKDFVSLLRVGVSSIKKGGTEAATGISTVGLALEKIIDRIPALQGMTEGFRRAADVGHAVAKAFSEIGRRSRGLEGDWERVLQMSSSIAESARAQTRAWRIMHQAELRAQKDIISAKEKRIIALDKEFNALQKETAQIEKTIPVNNTQIQQILEEVAAREQAIQKIDQEVAELKELQTAKAQVQITRVEELKNLQDEIARIEYSIVARRRDIEVKERAIELLDENSQAYRQLSFDLTKLNTEQTEEVATLQNTLAIRDQLNAKYTEEAQAIDTLTTQSSELQAERTSSANANIAAQDKINKLADEGMQLEGRRIKIQKDGVGIWQRIKNLTEENAKAQEQLNFQMHLAGPLIQQARSHFQTLATDVRHFAAQTKESGKIAAGRFEDMTLKVEHFKDELARLKKLGEPVPRDLAKGFRDLQIVLKQTSKFPEEMIEGMDKAAGSIGRVTGRTRELKEETKRFTRSMTLSTTSSRMLTRAIGEMGPGFSTTIMFVQQAGRQFTQVISQMRNAVENGAPKIQAALMLIKGGFVALGVVLSAFRIKTGLLSAEVTTLEVTMRTVATNLATEAKINIESFVQGVDRLRDSIRDTGITTREATNALTQFLRAKLPIGKVKQLAENAKNLGVTVAKMSTSEVFGRFIQFITSGNTALLKAINITKTAKQMYDEFAATIGKASGKLLTTAEKQLALIEGLNKATLTVAGVYDKAMLTAGKQLGSMKRHVEEALLLMGKRFEPGLAKLIFNVNKILKWFAKLPPAVIDSIASVIKWTITLSTLVGVIATVGPVIKKLLPVIRSLGTTIGVALPWLLAIGLAIGAIILAVKTLRKAWDQNFGRIQTAVKLVVDDLVRMFKPIVDDIRFWFREISRLIGLFSGGLSVLELKFSKIATALVRFSAALRKVFEQARDIINGFGRAAVGILEGFHELLGGDTEKAAAKFENAIVDVLTSVALIFQNYIARAATWGWNLIVEVANGIQKAATTVIAKVMGFVGSIISRFLAPGSPPEEGPLSHIVEWGRGIMETFLRAFGLADFGILKDVMAPLQQALRDSVAAGTLDEKDLFPTIGKIRKEVANLIKDFRESGEINEEVLAGISEKLGEGGQDLTEYIRRTLEHQRALRNLTTVQDEYAEAQAAGFIPAELKEKLEAAENEAKAMEEAVSWQREFIAATRETVDLQLKQVQLLERLAKAMEKIAAAPKGGKAGAGAPEELPFTLTIPEFDEDIISPLQDLEKLKLGGVSKEFEEMRLKVQAWVDTVKAWLALPFEDKLESIKTWLSDTGAKILTWLEDVTGIDFSQLIKNFKIWGAQKIRWLEDITGWDISGWLEDLQKILGEAWDWIVEKAEWLYDQLLGESYIPDIVNGIIEWFEKLEEWFKGTKLYGFFERVADFFEMLADIVPSIGLATLIAGLVALFTTPLGAGPMAAFVGVFASLGSTLTLVGAVLGEFVVWVVSIAAPVVATVTAIAAAIGVLAYSIYQNRDRLLGFWEDFKEQVTGMWEDVKPALEDIWAVVGPLLAKIGIAIAVVLTPAILNIISGIQALWDAVKAALPFIAQIFGGAISIIYGLIKTFILPVIDLFIAALSLLTGNNEEAMSAMWRAWENFKEGAILIWNGLKETIGAVFGGILETVGTFAGSFLGYLAGWVTGVLEFFGILDKDAGQAIRDFFDNAWDKAKNTLSQIWFIIWFYLTQAVLTVSGLADQIKTIWTALWGDEGYIMTTLRSIWTSITEWFEDLYKWLIGESLFQDIYDDIVKIWGDLWDWILTKTGEIITGVTTAVSDWYTVVVDWFEDIKTDAGLKWTEFWDGILAKITAIKAAILLVVANFVDIGTAFIDNIKQGIEDGWGAFIVWIKGKLGILADFFPGSEPKDPTSPLRGLRESGEAFWKNFIAGAESVDIAGAFAAQMSNITAQLGDANVSNDHRRFYDFQNATFAFPNVQDKGDAGLLVAQMQDYFNQADLRSR